MVKSMLQCDGLNCNEKFIPSWNGLSASIVEDAKKAGWVVKGERELCPDCGRGREVEMNRNPEFEKWLSSVLDQYETTDVDSLALALAFEAGLKSGAKKGIELAMAHLDAEHAVWDGTEIAPEHLLCQVLNNLKALRDRAERA